MRYILGVSLTVPLGQCKYETKVVLQSNELQYYICTLISLLKLNNIIIKNDWATQSILLQISLDTFLI